MDEGANSVLKRQVRSSLSTASFMTLLAACRCGSLRTGTQSSF